MATENWWMVRADTGGRLLLEFKDKGVAAIGWGEAGNVLAINSREALVRKMLETYSDYTHAQAISAAGQVYRFIHEIREKDKVISYDSSRRFYLLGVITGQAKFDESVIENLPNYRTVSWLKEVSRDALSTATKNTLGSTLTLFKLSNEAAGELRKVMKGEETQTSDSMIESDVAEEDLLKDIQERSTEFIKDKISSLDWDDMQTLVAGVLQAMGYKTRISPAGPDRGKDIVASPDGFGFEQPRIVVEVKHRRGAMGSQEIRSFLGGRHKDDKGLFVSTGGFSKEAHYEAERASIPLTLMDLDGLVAAILEHYENMDMESRVLIPLRRLYWPA